MTVTTGRPLVLDLLPATHGASITSVALWRNNSRVDLPAAHLDPDGFWRDYTGALIDPLAIIEFTVRTGPDTTTYTEGADTNEWTTTIRREARP